MHSAEQVVPIGERLVILARELTDDTNQTYLLAHKALRALLRTERSLGDAELGDLRRALSTAAEALGIGIAHAMAPVGLRKLER
jgi:hypothetical protein